MDNAAAFSERLAQGALICDGAMGTELARRGLAPGGVPELWNLEQPEAISDIHRAYVRAGCEAILTNTFGANRLRMATAGLADRGAEVVEAAVRLAMEAAGEKAFVLGDIGPTGHGDKLPPYGDMDEGEFRQAFGEQASALAASGVHAIYIETMSSVLEAAIAVRAAKEASRLPVICSMCFRKPSESAPEDFRTFWGDTVETIVAQLAGAGADVLGANCGEIAEETPRLARAMRRITRAPLAFEPNAGSPKLGEDGRSRYDMTPEDFAGLAVELVRSGVNMVGGCCGTTPDHMAAARLAVDKL